MVLHLLEPPLPEVPAYILELRAVQGDVPEGLAQLALDPEDGEVARVEALGYRVGEAGGRRQQGGVEGVVKVLLVGVPGGKGEEVGEVQG